MHVTSNPNTNTNPIILFSPTQRHTLDSRRWGYDYSALSKLFHDVEIYYADDTKYC